jgi:tetratricopeptide (TPR) repeat protein
LIPWLVIAGNFASEFSKIKATGDHDKIQKYVESVSESQKDNPEYYALVSNYWWELGKKTPNSAKPSEKGNINKYENGYPDSTLKAHDILLKGARKFPLRADIVLVLAHVQNDMGKDDACVKTLLTLLDTTSRDPSRLLWGNNESMPEKPSEFIPEVIQEYTHYYFNKATPQDDKRCITLCNAAIRVFPDSTYAYNMLAAVKAANQNHKESLSYLLLAHEKAPGDPVILINIGDSYMRLDRKEEAFEAYQKVLDSDTDENFKNLARDRIKGINR